MEDHNLFLSPCWGIALQMLILTAAGFLMLRGLVKRIANPYTHRSRISNPAERLNARKSVL